MEETQATDIVDQWDLDGGEYDTEGCIEDLMDGWTAEDKDKILERNKYIDD